MSGLSERREGFAQRITEMRGVMAGMDQLDDRTLFSSIDPTLQERLYFDRLRPRLVMRRSRRILPKGLFSPVKDSRERAILSGGAGLIETLSHAVGVHILWQDVVRLVRRSDVEALDDVLGLQSREIALVARDKTFGVEPLDSPAEQDSNLVQTSFIQRIKREGALSWACWLASCESVQARRLRIFTPDSVSSEVIGGLPGSLDQRNLRRRVVEFEMDRYLEPIQTESAEEEVQ